MTDSKPNQFILIFLLVNICVTISVTMKQKYYREVLHSRAFATENRIASVSSKSQCAYECNKDDSCIFANFGGIRNGYDFECELMTVDSDLSGVAATEDWRILGRYLNNINFVYIRIWKPIKYLQKEQVNMKGCISTSNLCSTCILIFMIVFYSI